MSYSIGADEPSTDPAPETEAVVLARLDKASVHLVQWTKDEDRRRTITLVIAGISALFAAVKLGWVVIPHLRKRRAAQLGQLASAVNPARRRRRRARRRS